MVTRDGARLTRPRATDRLAGVMRHAYVSLDPLLPVLARAGRPIDWAVEFGRAAPVDLEIGCGNGEYLVRHALATPDRDVVGLELLWGRVKKTLRKIGLAGVPNARVLYGDAHLALDRLIPPASLARAYALFPCPWPSSETDRRRLFGHAFLRTLNSRLAADGTAYVVTDDRPYRDWLLAQVPGSGFEAATRLVGPDHATKFERKWHAGGQTEFHRIDLVKVEHVTLPLKEATPMRTHLIEGFEPARLRMREAHTDDVRVRMKDLLYDPLRTVGMVHVVVVEDKLKQDLWIEIVPATGGWRIQPARGCNAVMTDGVQMALDLVLAACQGAAG